MRSRDGCGHESQEWRPWQPAVEPEREREEEKRGQEEHVALLDPQRETGREHRNLNDDPRDRRCGDGKKCTLGRASGSSPRERQPQQKQKRAGRQNRHREAQLGEVEQDPMPGGVEGIVLPRDILVGAEPAREPAPARELEQNVGAGRCHEERARDPVAAELGPEKAQRPRTRFGPELQEHLEQDRGR